MVYRTGGEVVAHDGGIGVEECGGVGEDDGFETIFPLEEGE